MCLAIILVGCNDSSLQPLASDDRIVAFGDSLTVGVGAGSSDAYPAVLQQLTGIEVINAGVSGETSQGGRNRLASVLDQYNPDLVILSHGGNDFLRRQDPVATKTNLAYMIELMQQRDIQVVLIGIPKPAIFLSSDGLYGDLADEYDIPLENHIMADLQGNQRLKSDQVHLNAEGYRQFARAIATLLRNAGAID
jgi:lysophospholipase L1-like esterase